MKNIESDVLKGYRFFGGAISVYSVSCMSNVIFNPSLLNWSSLILTVAHICYTYTVYVIICYVSYVYILNLLKYMLCKLCKLCIHT